MFCNLENYVNKYCPSIFKKKVKKQSNTAFGVIKRGNVEDDFGAPI